MKNKKNRDIPLSPQALLNIHCDKRAGQYLKQPDRNRNPFQNRSSCILQVKGPDQYKQDHIADRAPQTQSKAQKETTREVQVG